MGFQIFITMPARKSKKIAKAEKAAPSAHKEEEKDEPANEELFSQSFRDRLEHFSALTKDVLAQKAEINGTSSSAEVAERKARVSEKIEEASSAILKSELESLESWIGEQQSKLEEEVKQIRKAYEDNRASLAATGAFTDDEIKDQLAAVEKKAQDKQQIYDEYGELLDKSRAIYS